MFRKSAQGLCAGAIYPLTREDFLWALGSICQLHRVAFDAALVSGQFPGPHTTLTLIDAATRLGLKCAPHEDSAQKCERWSFPCLAWLEAGNDGASARPVLIASADAKRVLTFWPGEKAPRVLDREQFATLYRGM